MIQNPIRKVLSLIQTHQVKSLLMGGQACILYGAAEFSRDIDLAILVNDENIKRLKDLLSTLQATVIAVPPFDTDYLSRGHAVHFRCSNPEASGVRLDIMSRLRGVDEFIELWDRRTTIQYDNETYDLLSLPDLVKAKKTQRDKDWIMLRRLVEANYFSNQSNPNSEQVEFWLLELRTASILISLAQHYKELATALTRKRSLLTFALSSDSSNLESALLAEQEKEKLADREYWLPLRKELEKLRHK